MSLALSVVIPCYNESASLPALVARCAAVFTRADVEVILVDNGSTDATPEVMARCLGALPEGTPIRSLRVEPNRGYGGGILAGLAEGRGRVLAWTHADMQTDVADTLRGLDVFEASPEPDRVMVKGRRFGRPAADVLFTAGMSAIETLLFGRRFWDINAQPTMLPAAHVRAWRDAPTDFALDLFAYYTARRAGLRLRRIRVHFGARLHGQSHWNVDWAAKKRFIRRTLSFSLALRRGLHAGSRDGTEP